MNHHLRTKANTALTISVAIGTYNRADMVHQAVVEALQQSRKPIEVIVADDASTDHTADVISSLANTDARVRFIRQPKNLGVRNWNTALDAARGDLLAWCSDDDRFLEGHLEASAQYLEQHPEVGLVHSGFVDAVETPQGANREPRPLRSPSPICVSPDNLLPYLVRYYDWPFHASTIVMRREVWEQVGPFDPKYLLADTDWFVRAAKRFKTVLLPRHGVLNRRHPGNWSNRVGSAKMQAEIFEIVEHLIGERYAAQSDSVKLVPARWLARAAWRALWRVNVRLRLLLTLGARLRHGHTDAAIALWHTAGLETGRAFPKWVLDAGDKVIRLIADRRGVVADGIRESVSPL